MSTVILLPPELFKPGHCYKMNRKGKAWQFKVERYDPKMCVYHLTDDKTRVTLTQLEEEEIATIQEIDCLSGDVKPGPAS